MITYKPMFWGMKNKIISYIIEKKIKKPDKIIAISRGGLPIATIIAHYFNMRDICIIQISHYDENREQIRLDMDVSGVNLKHPDLYNILIVDDIVDTGDTFRLVKQVLPKARYFSFCVKEGSKHLPNYKCMIVKDDSWVVFPWEIE